MMKSDDIRDVVIFNYDDDSHLKDLANNGPTCLIHLSNAPIIHYLMIKLLNSKMSHFTIFCGRHKKSIRKFFKEISYQDYVNYTIKIDFIGDESINNVGDALRYLDNKKFDKEFLLVHGDTIIDCDIRDLVSTYQQSRKKHSDLILSMIVGLNQNQYCKPCDWLKIDKTHNIISSKGTVLSEDRPSDPQMYICSAQVPIRLQEHSECTTIYNLIDQIQIMSEISNDIVHIIPTFKLCCRLLSIESYFYANNKIIRSNIKLCSPCSIFGDNIRLVDSPTEIITSLQSSYVSSSLCKDFLPCSTRFIGNVFVDSASVIGQNCRLFDCVIGKCCVIGDNVILTKCVLMDGVIIGDNCLLSELFIGHDVTIGNRCQIVRSVVKYGPRVIEAHTKTQQEYIGDDCRLNIWGLRVLSDCPPAGNNETGVNEVEEINNNDEVVDEFEVEMIDLLKQAVDEGMSVADLKLDISRLRLAYDKPEQYLYIDVCVAFVKYGLRMAANNYGGVVKCLLDNYGAAISCLLEDDCEKKKLCLEAVQECACDNELVMKFVERIVFSMYENDVVEEDDIRDWYQTLVEDEDDVENTSRIRTNIKGLMAFLDEE